MGQTKSSEQLYHEQMQLSMETKRVITEQIVRLEMRRKQTMASATKALKTGNKEQAKRLLVNVQMADKGLNAMNSQLTHLDGLSQDVQTQNISKLMVQAASMYIEYGNACNNELSTEQIKELSQAFADANKASAERSTLVNGMFEQPESTVNVDSMLEQIEDQIAIDTLQQMPSVAAKHTLTTVQVQQQQSQQPQQQHTTTASNIHHHHKEQFNQDVVSQ
jgi:hypothetical protein